MKYQGYIKDTKISGKPFSIDSHHFINLYIFVDIRSRQAPIPIVPGGG